MFRTTERITENVTELVEIDAQISDLKTRQMVLVNDLSKAGAAHRDGARSMIEWLQAKLDLSRRNAAELVFAATWFKRHRPIADRLAGGQVSFDRAMAVLRLAVAGVDDEAVEAAYTVDQTTIARLTARYRRMTPLDEQRAFSDRYFSLQPTLDESSWRVAGQLPGVEGRVVEKALHDRADEFRQLPFGETATRAQRQADALVAMAQDSLDRDDEAVGDTTGSSVTVFVDVDRATGSGGELGAEVEYGPRVGPNTLDELLCSGSVQVVGLHDGRPVVSSDSTRAIPPAVRRFVAWRDGGCTIDGCRSRYRLQPHHIRQRRHGGAHDPENLTTLCWYHHHVAIHGQVFRIDATSPPLRRRLVRSRAGPDPPE